MDTKKHAFQILTPDISENENLRVPQREEGKWMFQIGTFVIGSVIVALISYYFFGIGKPDPNFEGGRRGREPKN